MSRLSGLRNDMNKRTFYKERKINIRSFDFLSKQNIIVPLILNITDNKEHNEIPCKIYVWVKMSKFVQKLVQKFYDKIF